MIEGIPGHPTEVAIQRLQVSNLHYADCRMVLNGSEDQAYGYETDLACTCTANDDVTTLITVIQDVRGMVLQLADTDEEEKT